MIRSGKSTLSVAWSGISMFDLVCLLSSLLLGSPVDDNFIPPDGFGEGGGFGAAWSGGNFAGGRAIKGAGACSASALGIATIGGNTGGGAFTMGSGSTESGE